MGKTHAKPGLCCKFDVRGHRPVQPPYLKKGVRQHKQAWLQRLIAGIQTRPLHFRPRSCGDLPPLVQRPSDPQAPFRCQDHHRLGSPQAADLALQCLELWDLSQGRQRHRAFATPSKVSVIGETALEQHRRQGCQGSPDPTASPMERRPCRSICPSKPSRIRGTKSGP